MNDPLHTPESTAELKPCAHCGAPAKLTMTSIGHWVGCLNQDCLQQTVAWINVEAAVNAWNKRPESALSETTQCKECGAKQAQIDRLMLEFCPEEMTLAQIEAWQRSQRAVTPKEEAAIALALKSLTGNA